MYVVVSTAVTDILSPYDMHKRTQSDVTVAPPLVASTSSPAYYHHYSGGGSGGAGQTVGMPASSYSAPASYHDYISHLAPPPVPSYPTQYVGPGTGTDYGQQATSAGFVSGSWFSPECHDSKLASEYLCTFAVFDGISTRIFIG